MLFSRNFFCGRSNIPHKQNKQKRAAFKLWMRVFVMRSEHNLLLRHNFSSSSHLNSTQLHMDAITESFAEKARDPYSLAAVVVGGAAFRAVRALSVSTLGGLVAESRVGAALLNVGANSVALVLEAGTFVTSERLLRVSLGGADQSLLRWEGANGLKNAWASSIVNFGALRGAGFVTAGTSGLVQHAASVSAMVSANHASAALGWTEAHAGTLMDEIVEASVLDLQMKAGMSLMHTFAPGITHWERSVDVAHEARLATLGRSFAHGETSTVQESLLPVMRAEEGDVRPEQAGREERTETPETPETPRVSVSNRLHLLGLGALSTFLLGFTTHTESLAMQAAAVGVGLAVVGKEVCDRYIWPRFRQSFIDKAQARGVDVSQIDVSGQALAPLREILQQTRVDFAQNKKIVVPNSLTAGAVVAALSACWASIAHRPLLTALGLGLAPFLDGIDGTVARKLKAASRSGALADDFADNVNNGPILGTLTFAHLANLGHPFLGMMTAAAFTLGIRTRLSAFRLFSDNPDLKPVEDRLGNPHYENGRGFLGVASPVAAMSVLGLYNSVHNSPYLFFGGCMFTAFSLVDMMARGKIAKALTGARAAAYSIPGGALALYQNLLDSGHVDGLTRTVDVLSSATASFVLCYIADPYVRAALRKVSRGSNGSLEPVKSALEREGLTGDSDAEIPPAPPRE